MTYILASTHQQFHIVVENEELDPKSCRRISRIEHCQGIERGATVIVAEPVLADSRQFHECWMILHERGMRIVDAYT